jgi:hypothetical protein
MRSALVVLVVLALASEARADPESEESESARGRAAFLAAGGVMLGGTVLAIAAASAGYTGLVVGVVPALAGAAACGVERGSTVYKGSCAGPILGAYLGAATAVPLAAAGAYLWPSDGEWYEHWEGMLLGFGVGWLVGTASGAVIGWNVVRTPRLYQPALAPPPRLVQGREPGLRVIAPLVAFAF